MNQSKWLAVLFIWLLLSAWCFSTFLCYSKGSDISQSNTVVTTDSIKNVASIPKSLWSFSDEKKHLKITSPQYIRFIISKFFPINLNKSMRSVLEKTADYLVEYPNTNLVITGYFHDSEQNNSTSPNLGLARASIIKKKLLQLGVTSEQIELDSKTIDLSYFENTILKKGIDFKFKQSK